MKKIFTILVFITAIMTSNAQDCSDIFISEYIEGSGNNKALEIYNPTDEIIDLSTYSIARYSNGSTNYTGGGITKLEGFLLPGGTFIFANGQTEDTDLGGGSISPKCDPALQAMANQLDGLYPAPTYMNGNDAIAILKDKSGILFPVDLFGTIGGNMTSTDEGWTDFTGEYAYKNIYNENNEITGKDSTMIIDYIAPDGYYWLPWTSNHSLKRKSSVKQGVKTNPSVFVVTMEWDTLAGGVDVWTDLGAHQCDCQSTNVRNFGEESVMKVFPNPSNGGQITIVSRESFSKIEIFNNTGALVKTFNDDSILLEKQYAVNDLTDGIYFIKVHLDKGKTLSQKLIKTSK